MRKVNDKQPTPIDWARLAAFIDGEGSISIKALKNLYGGARHYVMLQITNTDPALSVWLLETFGVGYVRPRDRVDKWSISYDWIVSGRTAMGLLEECLPYFVMKRAEAEVALRFRATGHRRGVRVSQDAVIARDELKHELHALKRRNRKPEAKELRKREEIHYA